jgi:cytochrome c-type biogenesis protein CcmH/NrfF
MRKWKTSVLIAAVAAICLAQSVSDMESPAVLRVADNLKCSCGCTLTMACKMEGDCQVCRRGKAKIFTLQQAGKSDDEIMAQFVREDGKDVVVQRPGFMGVGGVGLAALIGLGMVVLAIRHYRRHAPAAALVHAPEIDPETMARIEKDLNKLD